MSKKILVTGGAGYIGSTVCSALMDHGYTPIILDNLSTGEESFTTGRLFYRGDIADRSLLKKIKNENGPIEYVIHCAAAIIVPESVERPEHYYRENVSKSVELFSNLRDEGITKIIFSSSASIYGSSDGKIVKEDSIIAPSSPYARTKHMIEQILCDFCSAYNMQAISLRYFNPIGADPKLRTGPHAKDPTHLLGRLLQAAQGKLNFSITGNKWPTRDGTGIRDYIHVWDLALAHVNAISNFSYALSMRQPHGATHDNYRVINLGTGNGVTVKEFLEAFNKEVSAPIAFTYAEPRPGDVAGSFASADTALQLIKWSATQSIQKGIKDVLAWQEHRAKN